MAPVHNRRALSRRSRCGSAPRGGRAGTAGTGPIRRDGRSRVPERAISDFAAHRRRVRYAAGDALLAQIDDVELIRRADLAMYEAKRAGRGRLTVFESGLDSSSLCLDGPAGVLRQLVDP
jgi:hypothetical protein